MSRLLAVFVVCVVGTVGATPIFAADLPTDALGWLTAMRDARKSVGYSGTAALLRDDQVQMVSVAHCIVDGVERESMRSLDDPSRNVVRQEGRAVYFLPEAQRSLSGGKVTRWDGMGSLPEDLAGFRRFYRFSLGAREYLIGRSTQEVVIEPLDGYRYGRRFWIDVDSKLPLKYQVFNDGNILEQLVFTQLSLNTPPTKVERGVKAEEVPAAAEVLPLESLRWRLDRVPAGYRLVSYMRHSPPGKKPMEHLLLSDGLSALSLYIEDSDGVVQAKKQVRHFGPIHLYLRSIGRYQVTVMGEAPVAAVGLVGDGVHPVARP